MLNRRSARVRSDRPKRTKRRRRLQRLLQEETQFRAIFESAAFGIVLADAEGRPLDCNPTLERMLGYTTDEFRTMRISDFIYTRTMPRRPNTPCKRSLRGSSSTSALSNATSERTAVSSG